jgi:hypothetical protein
MMSGVAFHRWRVFIARLLPPQVDLSFILESPEEADGRALIQADLVVS